MMRQTGLWWAVGGAVAVVMLVVVGSAKLAATNGTDDTNIKMRREAFGAAKDAWVQLTKLEMSAEEKEKPELEGKAFDLAQDARRIASGLAPSVVKGINLVEMNHTLYKADYDVTKPLLGHPREYGYLKHNNLFKYPEDNPKSSIHKIPHALMAYQPRAYLFPGFLTHEETDELKRVAKPLLKRSEVVPTGSDSRGSVDDVRTSQSAWIPNDLELSRKIQKRISRVTGFPVEWFEDLQVLRYQKGQKYEPHFDYFDPAIYGEPATGPNRVATFYTFLSEVEAGGHFWLPRANNQTGPDSFDTCEQGLRIVPHTGNSLLFYGIRPDSSLDPHSLHGACAVGSGIKWGLVQWIKTGQD